MPLPILSLPVVQNWDCHSCGDCCRRYAVTVTPEEAQRIRDQGWDADDELRGQAVLEPSRERGGEQLRRLGDGSCIFLRSDGRCRIHAKFGSAAKPLACRIYPFVLVPADGGWRIGLRYSCPSVTANRGRPMADHQTDLENYGREIDRRESVSARAIDRPTLKPGREINWTDLHRFTRSFVEIISHTDRPLTQRLRECLALARIADGADFQKVTGRRLGEFLAVIRPALEAEIVADPGRPSGLGGMIFRLTAASYLRRDTGPARGRLRFGSLSRLAAAWGFARGRGRVPSIHAELPIVRFDELEQPSGELSESADELLTRYYRVKWESLQFFGPTNFSKHYWDGVYDLIGTYPVIRWLARAWRNDGPDVAVDRALQIVDDHFAYHPALGTSRQAWLMRQLAGRDLDRLIAWYAR